MMDLPTIKNINVKGKRVFLRADLDVPLSEDRRRRTEDLLRREASRRRIEDDTRLVAAIPTIKYLLEQGAKVIVAGHLDRPGGVYKKELSLEPIGHWFAKEFKVQSSKCKVDGFSGWMLGENLVILENLRFNPGEENNNEEFAKELAMLADIYVNDAFAMCHRAHASVVGVSKLLPHYGGFHLVREVEELSKVLNNPQRPLVVVIGGIKIETKLPLIEKMEKIADYVLVGGLVAQESPLRSAKQNFEGQARVIIAGANKDKTDISEDSITRFKQIIASAETIVWNGPMGRISSKFKVQSFDFTQDKSSKLDREDTERGTREIAEAIVQSKAYKIAGGGDTTEYIKRIGLSHKFDFVSTGGGAMLSFLSGEELPGLEALIK